MRELGRGTDGRQETCLELVESFCSTSRAQPGQLSAGTAVNPGHGLPSDIISNAEKYILSSSLTSKMGTNVERLVPAPGPVRRKGYSDQFTAYVN